MMPNIVRSPSETLKPAKSMIASEGMGMQADSSSIRMKTPIRPTASMKSVAASTIGSTMKSVTEARVVTREGVNVGRRWDAKAPPGSLGG